MSEDSNRKKCLDASCFSNTKFTTKLYPYWKLRKSSLIKICAAGIMSALFRLFQLILEKKRNSTCL